MRPSQPITKWIVKARRTSEYWGRYGELVLNSSEAVRMNKSAAEHIAQELTHEYGKVFYTLEA